jgi:hypothetical protein
MLHGRLGWDTSSATPAIRSGRHRWYGPWTCADATSGDGQLVVLSRPGTASPAGFQHIPETKSGQNRPRLGQAGDDLDAATADAETLGGRWPEPGQIRRTNQTCDQGASPCCAWPFQHPQRGGCVATPGCLTWIAGAALPGRGTVTAARSASAASKPG